MKATSSKINAFLLFFSFVLIFALFLAPPTRSFLKSTSTSLISSFGLFGLFMMIVLMDTIIQPISPDILVFGSTFGGASLFWATLIGGLASCLAGVIGYHLGKRLGRDRFEKWFGEGHVKRGHYMFEKYGVWAVIVGALSPIPYSSICWTAGIYRMSFVPFLITSLLTRVPRFFIMGLIGFSL